MTEQIAVREAPESTEPPIEQRAQPNVGDYRYPGVPPFEDSEMDRLVFRGRSKEIDRVLHSILSFDLFLIYAVSGLGKSSLLAAGVAEPLRQRDFFPVTIRLNDPTSSPVALIGEQLREAASKAEGITITRHPAVRDVEGTPSTLWDLLCGLEVWKGNTLQHLVLIFDQFEELFTLGWSAEQRTQFIEQFGQVVRRHRPMPVGRETDPAALLPPPAVKITLVIREDSLGELEAMADCVPQIMRHRFRLDGLTQDQAERAIREPAQVSDPRLSTPQFGFSEGAARAILAFLGARQERGRPVLTGTIDPSQLQIICQHVERSILPNKPAVDADSVVEISEEDLGGKSGLERILRDFYRRELWTFPVEQRKLVRHLCETGLINQRGRRLSLEEEEIAAKYKLSKATLEALVSHRLLRAEPRVGSVYYELGHDTLAAPILAYRDGVKSARRKRLLGLSLALVAVAIVGVVLWAWSSGDDHASAPIAQQIAIGVPMKGTIPTSGTSEFVFDAPGSQTLRVNLDPRTNPDSEANLDATLEVSDPQGLPLQTNNVVGQAAQSVLVDRTVTGTYRVVVHGQSSRPFTLTVSQVEVMSMAIGDTTLGAVDADHPDAVFEFEALADRALIIEFAPKPGAGLDATLEMITPDGNPQWADSSVAGGVQDVFVDPTVAGRYRVIVNSSKPRRFELTVRQVEVTGMAVGDTKSGTLDSVHPDAVFEFEATTDQPVTVEVAPKPANSLGAVTIEMIDPNNLSQWADNVFEGGTQSVVVDGTVTGTYRVIVHGQSAGGFELTVRQVTVAGIAVGDTKSGALDADQPDAAFEFEAATGQPLTVRIAPKLGDGLNATLEMIDPSGFAQWADNGFTGGAQSVLLDGTATGTYRVIVHGRSAGDFELTIRRVEAVEISVGDTKAGTIDAAHPDAAFEFDATDDEPLNIEVAPKPTNGPGAVTLEVIDPEGLAQSPDNYFVGGAQSLLVDGTVTGHYRVIVHGQSAGDFVLTVRPADLTEMAIGDTASGTIDTGKPGGVFEFDAAGAQLLIIEAKPGDGLDVALEVTNPDGVVDGADSVVEGGTETVLVNGTVKGRYQVIVRGRSSGPFELTVRTANVVTMTVGSAGVSANIDATASAAVFDFEPPDSRTYVVKVKPAVTLDAVVRMTDPNGFVDEEDWGAEGGTETAVVDRAVKGRYLVVVTGFETTMGKFDVSVRPADVVRTSIGDTKSARIDASDPTAVFEFDASDGRPFTVSVEPESSLHAVLQLTGPSGNLDETSNYDEGGAVTLTADGTVHGRYTVVVSGYRSTTGRFQLSVQAG